MMNKGNIISLLDMNFIHYYSMQVMNHRRSPNIEFFAEGIAGKDSKNKKGWTMKSFKTFLQENGDNGVSLHTKRNCFHYEKSKTC